MVIKRAFIGVGVITVFLLTFIGVYFYNSINLKDDILIKRTVYTCLNMGNDFWAFTKKNYKKLTSMGIEKADAYLQNKVISEFENILTGKLLTVNRGLVKKCSWYSEDYQILFSNFQDVKVDKMQVVKKGLDEAVCKVFYRSKVTTNLSEYGDYNLKNLVRDYKIKNSNQAKLNNTKFLDFVLSINNVDNYYLKKIKSNWYIYKIEGTILKSTIELIK